MKKTLCIVIAIICIFSFAIFCFAHSGRTDSSGGHYDRSTGEYHYHHGYPAHSHSNGECPYDFDDKTNHGNSNTDNLLVETKSYVKIAILSLLFSILPTLFLSIIINSLYHFITKQDIKDKTFNIILIISFVSSTIIIFYLFSQY